MTPKHLVTSIRKEGNLSQVQVSQLTGLPQGTISKIERGAVSDIYSRNYLALLALYHDILARKQVRNESGAAALNRL